jgi:hypothetical protein
LCVATAIDPRFKTLPFLEEEEREEVYTALASTSCSSPAPKARSIQVKVEPGHDLENNPLPELPALPGVPAMPEEPAVIKTESEEPSQSVSKTAPCSLLQDLLGDVYVTGYEPQKSRSELVQLELAKYRSQKPIPLKDNPLEWWKQNEQYYPMLARMAKRLLCVPATSVPSERVFSTAGDIVTATRAQLKAKHVDMLIFLKKNT